ELLVLETIPHALVALTVDTLEQEECATGPADEEGNEGPDCRSSGGNEAVDEELIVVGRDVADTHAIHRHRDGNQRGVDKRQTANTPDAQRLHHREEQPGKLMQQRYRSKFHKYPFYGSNRLRRAAVFRVA